MFKKGDRVRCKSEDRIGTFGDPCSTARNNANGTGPRFWVNWDGVGQAYSTHETMDYWASHLESIDPPKDEPAEALGENPKNAAGQAKPCLSFMPTNVLFEVAKVHRLGAEKYGKGNWCDSIIKNSVYHDAIQRHLAQWFYGEDKDEESGCSHLAHIVACCLIVMDCKARGTVDDDRPKPLPEGWING